MTAERTHPGQPSGRRIRGIAEYPAMEASGKGIWLNPFRSWDNSLWVSGNCCSPADRLDSLDRYTLSGPSRPLKIVSVLNVPCSRSRKGLVIIPSIISVTFWAEREVLP